MESNAEKEQIIKQRIRRIQRFLTVFVVLCLCYLVIYEWDSHRQAEEAARLQEIAGAFAEPSSESAVIPPAETTDSVSVAQNSGENDLSVSSVTGEEQPEAGEPESGRERALSGYEDLLKINPQILGWIAIPGTRLSFPLLQGEDNDFYLHHNIYGQESRYGAIFADYKADLYGGESNIIIYGHHMRNGSMFGSLEEYDSRPYYEEHPSFFLLLPEEEREYEIIAVLKNDIYSREKEPFQYYDYERIESKEMFDEYCQGIKSYSLYDTGRTAEYGDELVTLCTCSYSGRDERLLIVGRCLQ